MTEHSEIMNSESLVKVIIGALPEIQERTFSFLGRRPRRIPKRDRVHFEQKLRTLVHTIAAECEKLAQCDVQADPAKLAFGLENLLTILVRAGGIRRKHGEDVLNMLLRFALRQTVPFRHPWTRTPVYDSTRQAVWRFVVHLHERLGAPATWAAIEHWAEREGEKHMAFVRQLETAVRRFRVRPPMRLTDRLVVDLQQEYRLSSAFFENRLRFLLYLARAGSPKSKSWSDWKKERLNNLLEMAKREPDLATLVGGIDRPVRNALAHGAPAIDMATGCCEFEDSSRNIRWTFDEFFARTRSLTITAVALGSLEPFLEYAHVCWLVWVLRSLKAAGGQGI
jgi:hypothetical protein